MPTVPKFLFSIGIIVLVGIASPYPAYAGRAEAQNAFNRGDYAEAVRQFRPLAEQGDAEAQANLGSAYAVGGGVPKDSAQAFYWHSKAARQGYAPAQMLLGLAYANGDGVPQDRSQAIFWWRKAAAQGDPVARQLLNSLGIN